MRPRLERHWILLLVAVVFLACQDSEQQEGDKTAKADSTASDTTAADTTQEKKVEVLDAVPVEAKPAILGPISNFLVFSSTIETEDAVEVYPQINGLVKAIEVEEGTRVVEGQVLVRLETEEAEIELRESQANLRHLDVGFQRTSQMFDGKLISLQEYENERYQHEQAKIRLERAQLALKHTVIRAPFAGMITSRTVQVGARIGPGSKLFDLVRLEDMIARVYVSGQHLTTIAKGQKALATSDFLPGKEFEGQVKRISPVVDPRSGTFKVTVGLEDQRWEHLRPGLFVNVQIITDTHEEAVLVPKEAVVYDGGERFVFLVADSLAQKVELEAGFENNKWVEALSKVEPGTGVIVVGQNGLKDQARIRVVNQSNALESGETSSDPDQQG